MTDHALRALERDAQAGDPEAERRLVAARLRAGGRDPRHEPRKDDVVDATGPGARVRSHRTPGSWGGRSKGTGPVCRSRGRVVVNIWPQVTVAEVQAVRDDGPSSLIYNEPLVLPAGTRVSRAAYYSASRDVTTLSVTWLTGVAQGPPVDVIVKGRVETRVPSDRLDSYEVEWAPVLYPEVADAASVQEALRVLESAGLPASEVAALRERLRPRPDGGLASAAIRWGEAKTEHVNQWRQWAKTGTVRRIGGDHAR